MLSSQQHSNGASKQIVIYKVVADEDFFCIDQFDAMMAYSKYFVEGNYSEVIHQYNQIFR